MENETELIRQQMLETRTALSEKLEALESQVLSTVEDTTRTVKDTVQTVQEAVQDTVGTVSETVQDTVDSVKKTFDVNEQMQAHPWLMLGGAVALGYVGGRLLDSSAVQGPASGMNLSSTGYANGTATAPPTQPSQPSWLDNLAGPVLEKVKEMAIGALAGVAVDMIRQHAPADFRPHLDDLANQITEALGTRPLHGLWSDGSAEKTSS